MNEQPIDWVACDPASQRVLELARKVTGTSTTVLITGESGTGKDQLARLIHELSPRRNQPYLKIDCASLPQELVESELFGHERGAFTGAVERKLGRLEMAGSGTIVLDEVAALSPATQSKLLRVLEERRFERLGGVDTLTIEARLIALTNSDLARAAAAKTFREDLYFRLSVLTIQVPPLRERRSDVAPLTEHLLARLTAMHGRPGTTLGDSARRALEGGHWMLTPPHELSKHSGVRRVNNLPVYLVGGAVAGFLGIMVVVAADRAAASKRQTYSLTISTRRFLVRPSALSFDATGRSPCTSPSCSTRVAIRKASRGSGRWLSSRNRSSS